MKLAGTVWRVALLSALTAAWLGLGAANAAAITAITTHITTPKDGSLLFQNEASAPTRTFTVSGTSTGLANQTVDIGCYMGGKESTHYDSVPVDGQGNFSAQVTQQTFGEKSCDLLAVPHGTSPTPPAGFTGPRVGFSALIPLTDGSGLYDFYFTDATTLANATIDSVDSCGPYTNLESGTSTMTASQFNFNCGGSLYTAPSQFFATNNLDLTRSEIQVGGQNAYGSDGAKSLFQNSDQVPGYQPASVQVNSFSAKTGNAVVTDTEPLVECSPNDVWGPTSTDCTSFVAAGVTLKRATGFSHSGHIQRVTDTFSNTTGQSKSVDLLYEMDLDTSTAGWMLPGQASFTQHQTGDTAGAPASHPGSVYTIDDVGSSASFANPVGALTFLRPYGSVTFDNTLWSTYNSTGQESALFHYGRTIPAHKSTVITLIYSTGNTLAQVRKDADLYAPAKVSITAPAAGSTTHLASVVGSGAASAGSGIRSVGVNGVKATVTGNRYRATVPLRKGQNTITATITSAAGDVAHASDTVTYVPKPG